MAGDSLKGYIQDKINQGYDLLSVKQFLLSQGYSSEQVEKACRAFSSSSGYSGKKAVIVAVIIIASLLMFGSAYFAFYKSDQGHLKIKVQSSFISDTYVPGDPVDISVNIIDANKGSRSYEVFLTYKVIDSSTREVVFFKEETLQLIGQKRAERQVFLPESFSEGKYSLETTAKVDTKAFMNTLRFSVKKSEEQPSYDGSSDDEDVNEKNALNKNAESLSEKKPFFRIIPENPSRTRVVFKEPSLPSGRDYSNIIVKRMGPV